MNTENPGENYQPPRQDEEGRCYFTTEEIIASKKAAQKPDNKLVEMCWEGFD
jgi:hypothetical protein